MTIERTDSEIIIRIAPVIDIEELQRLLNYLIYKEVTSESQATQEQIDELAKEVNQNWWQENKNRFLKS